LTIAIAFTLSQSVPDERLPDAAAATDTRAARSLIHSRAGIGY
jgi:hypothetical protein